MDPGTDSPPPARAAVLYLASRSPRRRALLEQVGLVFATVAVAVDEAPLHAEQPADFTQRLAVAKAAAGRTHARRAGWPARPVLGADTCVAVAGEMLGKPRDRDDATRMLRALSGRTHEVYTGIAVDHAGTCRGALSVSRVTFARLTDAQIDAYWHTGEPRDKAGGYAIQGRGGGFVARLEGSYSGVVGLPLFELRELLLQIGVDWL